MLSPLALNFSTAVFTKSKKLAEDSSPFMIPLAFSRLKTELSIPRETFGFPILGTPLARAEACTTFLAGFLNPTGPDPPLAAAGVPAQQMTSSTKLIWMALLLHLRGSLFLSCGLAFPFPRDWFGIEAAAAAAPSAFGAASSLAAALLVSLASLAASNMPA